MAIDATICGRNANSYVTVAEAEAYFANRLYAAEWHDAQQAQKEAALIMATNVIDRAVRWRGVIATEEQALSLPRKYLYDRNKRLQPTDAIPVDVKMATYEQALDFLIWDSTRLSEYQKQFYQGIASASVGGLSVSFNGQRYAERLCQKSHDILRFACLGSLVDDKVSFVDVHR